MSATFSNMQPGKTYTVSVKATDEFQKHDTKTGTIDTTANAVTAGTVNAASDVTTHSAKISWAAR